MARLNIQIRYLFKNGFDAHSFSQMLTHFIDAPQPESISTTVNIFLEPFYF
jgi:hypothetical protein